MSALADTLRAGPLEVPGIATDLAAITAARHAHAPGRLWIADLSQVWGGTSWLYFAYVLDRDSRRCLAWSPHRVAHAELIADALGEAAAHRLRSDLQPPVAVVFGRGCRTAELDFPDWAIPAASDASLCESFVAAIRQAALDDEGESRWSSFPEVRDGVAAWIDQTYNPRSAAPALQPVG